MIEHQYCLVAVFKSCLVIRKLFVIVDFVAPDAVPGLINTLFTVLWCSQFAAFSVSDIPPTAETFFQPVVTVEIMVVTVTDKKADHQAQRSLWLENNMLNDSKN